MKLGEIKAQAITIMFPQATIKLDTPSDEGIIRAIYEMKSNPNFESILEGSIGAINRAFSYIELNDLSETKCVDVPSSLCKRQNDKILLPKENDLLRVERVLFHTYDKAIQQEFDIGNEGILTKYRQGVYTVIYKRKIPRITSVTSDAYEPELPYGMAEYIPYFIASDLARDENEALAKYALDHFENGIKALKGKEAPCSQCFEIVYRWD